ncbi:unnamed protein product [Urochloa decumbens]|uniref:Myb/SANT-like DNA-binding domain-containing protein n=1 Tax=Urochloa decumbens TaxID=240449 RepID=A0ABC9GU42_9POAL
MGDDAAHELETLAAAMVDGAAAAGSPSPSPSPSSPSSSGASPSPSSPGTKRRRTDRYALGFEFAPRLAPYEVEVLAPRAAPKWTERSTFALLDAWGDRFVRTGAGRAGISADEWLEVARLASAGAGHPPGYFSETHCRNRIDTLRKQFKKEMERIRLSARRDVPSAFGPVKWVYYDKMASILCPSPPTPLPPPFQPPVVKRRRDTQPSPRLGWGMKAPESLLGSCGEPRRPAVCGTGPELGPGPELGEPKPQTVSPVEGNRDGFMALTESIQKFGEIFARMESSKRRHMAEVEQMRRDLQRDLDAKWREILEKAQAEIACLSDEDGYESDVEEDGDGGDDKGLEDGGGEEQNNGTVDASP